MGCYGIGVGRLLAATVEQTHDKAGMVLPEAVAPYAVRLAALNVEREDVAEAADALYNNLTEAGVEVLYDDRQESVGVKFNDAELLGLPILLVVSPRKHHQGRGRGPPARRRRIHPRPPRRRRRIRPVPPHRPASPSKSASSQAQRRPPPCGCGINAGRRGHT